MADIAARFGAVSVESTRRSRGHNGQAVRCPAFPSSVLPGCRFSMRPRHGGIMAYLRSRPEVGGLKIITPASSISTTRAPQLVRM